MKPFRVDTTKTIEFLADDPLEAIQQATEWLAETNKKGKTNLFYFLGMRLEHQSELGWLAIVSCGGDVLK